jgi:hypothetical protein
MTSNPPPHILRWSEDEENGQLDVYNIAALRARLEEENPAGVPTPLALNTQMAIGTHPFAQASGLETKPRAHLEAQPTRSEETAQPTTWHGIPLLPEDNAASNFVDAKRWNLFAAHVTEEAAPQAAFLFRELQKRLTSSEDAKG